MVRPTQSFGSNLTRENRGTDFRHNTLCRTLPLSSITEKIFTLWLKMIIKILLQNPVPVTPTLIWGPKWNCCQERKWVWLGVQQFLNNHNNLWWISKSAKKVEATALRRRPWNPPIGHLLFCNDLFAFHSITVGLPQLFWKLSCCLPYCTSSTSFAYFRFGYLYTPAGTPTWA